MEIINCYDHGWFMTENLMWLAQALNNDCWKFSSLFKILNKIIKKTGKPVFDKIDFVFQWCFVSYFGGIKYLNKNFDFSETNFVG